MMGYFGGDILAREIALLSGPNTDQYVRDTWCLIMCAVWSCGTCILMQPEEYQDIVSFACIAGMAQLLYVPSMHTTFANTPLWTYFPKVTPKRTLLVTITVLALDHHKVVKLGTLLFCSLPFRIQEIRK